MFKKRKSTRIFTMTAMLFLALMFSMYALTKVNAAIFFQDGFESGNFNNWTTQGLPTIVTTPVANGTRAAQFTLTAPTNVQTPLQQANTLTLEFYFRIDTIPQSTDATGFALINNTQGVVFFMVIHRNQGGGLEWGVQYRANGTSFGTVIGSNIQTNTWYKIDLALTISISNGTYQLWINNAPMWSLTNVNNDNNGQGYKLSLGTPLAYPVAQGNMWIDSVILSNTIDDPIIPEFPTSVALVIALFAFSSVAVVAKKRFFVK